MSIVEPLADLTGRLNRKTSDPVVRGELKDSASVGDVELF